MIDFKTDRVESEWRDPRLRADLKAMVYALSGFVSEWGKDLVVTGLFRTEEEQRALYPQEPTRVSVHQLWRGADLRDSLYSDAERRAMLHFLLRHFDYDGVHAPVLRHDSGHGSHFHLQAPAGALGLSL